MPYHAPERYARQLALPGFGVEGQSRLAAARVLVIGAGGLGSSVLPALAAAGVGTIGIIDDDRVEVSNLHRQHIHGSADVGRAKVSSAADRLRELNPHVSVTPIDDRLDSANAEHLFADYDLVIDGSDNFPTRYLANDAAALAGLPLVWGAVSQYAGQAGVAWVGRGPGYRDLFPAPPPPGSVLSCADGGVLPTVCAVIGSVMATEAIKVITGLGEPLLGRVLTFDALTGSFRELEYQRDPDAPPITALIDYDAFCGIGPAPAERGTGATSEHEIHARALAETLAAGQPLTLLDVREPWEAAIASLPGSVLVPLGRLQDAASGLTAAAGTEGQRPIIVYCHQGIRSERALEILRGAGVAGARHLVGGIDAWSREVDPSLARY